MQELIEKGKIVRFLMRSRSFTLIEARHIAKTVPSLNTHTRPPIPVRMTHLKYPENFIGSSWNAAPIVDFVRISGYIIVLTVDRGSERLVRSLMGDLWNRGTRLRQPTLEEVAKFHEKRYESGLLRPKPTPRCTKEAKNWREFLTGQPIAESDDSDSED
ncbi:hypothetical protein pipiens_018138 [Culex pipiens pipiens]|uniref:Uncharacterized protein n=1 Tax=Culex pipiens pipiens TaxID=38569 RepID=A0ABD1CD70_CULPP